MSIKFRLAANSAGTSEISTIVEFTTCTPKEIVSALCGILSALGSAESEDKLSDALSGGVDFATWYEGDVMLFSAERIN